CGRAARVVAAPGTAEGADARRSAARAHSARRPPPRCTGDAVGPPHGGLTVCRRRGPGGPCCVYLRPGTLAAPTAPPAAERGRRGGGLARFRGRRLFRRVRRPGRSLPPRPRPARRPPLP